MRPRSGGKCRRAQGLPRVLTQPRTQYMSRVTEFETHRFSGEAPGPKLLVLGAVHGNETCGTRAIEQVLQDLESGALKLLSGELTLVPVTNPKAYDLGQRGVDRNLNRLLRHKPDPQDNEDEVANLLVPLLDEHEVLLDLHSFHTPGDPFALLGPEDNDGTLEPFTHQAAETDLILHLGPKRFVEGWMGVYEAGVAARKASARPSPEHLLDTEFGVGTTEYFRTQGGYGVTYECGYHDEAAAPGRGLYAILQTLKLLGMIDGAPEPPPEDFQILKLVDVVDRLDEGDTLVREFNSFDPIKKGDKIGTRADGTEVLADRDGYIVFPNPAADVYAEWYYYAVESDRVLTVSK